MDLVSQLRRLPKAELHLHLDGALRVATAIELAREDGLRLPADEIKRRMVGPAVCRDQAELLTFFDLPISLLQSEAALSRVAGELVEDLAVEHVRYAEIRWAPRLHLERGLSIDEVIEAVASGVARAAGALRSPMEVGLIVTAMRSHPPAANVELARRAAAFGPPVVGFDLAGPEARYPAPPHAAAFFTAADGGLQLTAHAGEVRGSERIREVLSLGVTRIAHGATTADDPQLLDEVRERGVTLDLCPTSNVQAALVASLPAMPVAKLHRAGVSVTISTDDPTVNRTSLTRELVATAKAQSLTPAELADIAVNAFARGFGPIHRRRPLEVKARQAWQEWATRNPSLTGGAAGADAKLPTDLPQSR
jgi:adenosine deaminase